MLKSILTIVAFLVSFNLLAQGPPMAQFNRAPPLKTMPVAPPEVEGTVFLNDEWVVGTIEIKKNTLVEDVPIRYNMDNQTLEIKYEGEIKICPLERLQSFAYLNFKGSQFKYYNTSEVNNISFDIPKGICRVIVNDKVKLLQYVYLETIKSNYNVALATGDPNHKLVKKETPYAIVDDQVYEVKNSLKRNSAIFGDKSDKIKAFTKKNKLNFKDENDLTQIFEYFNSLL
ncbi:MAG: hypothetical protein RLO12_14000 [Fulvivirga sp.]